MQIVYVNTFTDISTFQNGLTDLLIFLRSYFLTLNVIDEFARIWKFNDSA